MSEKDLAIFSKIANQIASGQETQPYLAGCKLTLNPVWQHLLSGAEVDSPLSMFFRLIGSLAYDLPIGDVLKTHSGSDLKSFL